MTQFLLELIVSLSLPLASQILEKEMPRHGVRPDRKSYNIATFAAAQVRFGFNRSLVRCCVVTAPAFMIVDVCAVRWSGQERIACVAAAGEDGGTCDSLALPPSWCVVRPL